MLKRIRLSVLFIVFSLPLFAQISVNPQNEFYSDAASWYLKGYVDSLPQVKPYPAAVIKEILENTMLFSRFLLFAVEFLWKNLRRDGKCHSVGSFCSLVSACEWLFPFFALSVALV